MRRFADTVVVAFVVASVLALDAGSSIFVAARTEAAPSAREREPIVGRPCEGCEAVFDGLPVALESQARIAPPDEPGEAMRIEGTVVDALGRPAPGVVVYAYHTNARGIYPRDERLRGRPGYRHGTLRGWARTDDRGHYRFDTIRPVGYPGTDMPAHVHMHVIEIGHCTYYIDSIEFLDDPRLPRTARESRDGCRGGCGLVMPRRDENGVWHVTRDIVLGESVPGYLTQ
jgi:protocatechuate 3,4-dioxygenase beta subunit